jgi:FkbM family methyltransferase
MNQLKKYLLNKFNKHFSGKKRLQKIFNLTKNLSLQGLNYGNGSAIETSGEIALIKQLANKYTDSRTYIIFDVGANRGDYCTELVKNIKINDLQIWCFEPSKETFKNLQLTHSSKNNVFLNNIGFSDQNHEVPLYSNEPGAHIASLFPLERAFGMEEKLSDFEMVSIKKIDDFLIENNIPYIDLLKLDIEGNELNALMGASKAMRAGKIKSIQFEFGSCNIDSRTYFRDFWSFLSPQYNLYRLLKDGLHHITYYSEYDEVFTTINYYAELK